MLKSLFGELSAEFTPLKSSTEVESESGFASTRLFEDSHIAVNDRGQRTERHATELMVSGPVAMALREHFAMVGAEPQGDDQWITLLDPMEAWAGAVIKALSDTGGHPVERLHLRDPSTLRGLATVERTTLERRDEPRLKVLHTLLRAPVRTPLGDDINIPLALAERSHLTVVLIGPMQPHAIEALLETLLTATYGPEWRCPQLLFIAPPSALWIEPKLRAMKWPSSLQLHVSHEPVASASELWNSLLTHWQSTLSTHPQVQQLLLPSVMQHYGLNDFTVKVAELPSGEALPSAEADTEPGELTELDAPEALEAEADAGDEAPEPDDAASAELPASERNVPSIATLRQARPLDLARAQSALLTMDELPNLPGCGVVHINTGRLVARHITLGTGLDLELCARLGASLMRGHLDMARTLKLGRTVDEVVSGAGVHMVVMRYIPRHPSHMLIAVARREDGNLALLRLKLMNLAKAMQ